MARPGIAHFVATLGGLGDRLPAPGTTAGSLPAAAAVWLGCLLLPDQTTRLAALAMATLLVTIAGIWAADREAKRRLTNDPGPVVVDEVAGQWLALLVVLVSTGPVSGGHLATIIGVGFAVFRILDIAKPWPIRGIERLPGGIGIVADDLAAGLIAGLILVAGWLWLT